MNTLTRWRQGAWIAVVFAMVRSPLAGLDAAKETTMSMDLGSDAWSVADKRARIEEYKGSRALCLQGGYACLRGLAFRDGVIECDLASPVARSYLGVIFRMQSEEDYELIYFQPHTSGKWDAVQYDPVFNGSTTWQLHHGPKYQAEATVPTHEWFHNRHFKKPAGEATAFAKLTLQSESEQNRTLLFGYSDKIVVFLNGKQLYSGDNSFGVSKQPGARGYVKDGEFSVDLPLKKGSNELLLAISEKAFDWGFIARLDQVAGIKPAKLPYAPDTINKGGN